MQDNNPYQTPGANVVEPLSGKAILLAFPQAVSFSRGATWYLDAFQLFRQAPGQWVLALVIMLGLAFLLGMIPFVNLVVMFIAPVFTAGLMVGCQEEDRGKGFQFSHVFAAFSTHASPLLLFVMLTLLAGVLIVLIGVALSIVVVETNVTSVSGGEHQLLLGFPVMVWGVLLSMVLLGMPFLMLTWFVPTLIVLHSMSVFSAMQLSFMGCVRNVLPFLVYGVVYLLLGLVASFSLMLGWIVLIPVVYITFYISYKDIFLQKT